MRRQEAANQLETCGWPKMSSNVNKLRQRRLIWRGFSSSPRWDLQHSNPIFFFNKNSIKDGATVYKEINQWADGPVGELQGYEMKNKLLPWQREVGPMLSESKEETLNRVLKIFPFVLPPPMEGNWKVSTLRPCSPRKVVWWRKKKCNFTAC